LVARLCVIRVSVGKVLVVFSPLPFARLLPLVLSLGTPCLRHLALLLVFLLGIVGQHVLFEVVLLGASEGDESVPLECCVGGAVGPEDALSLGVDPSEESSMLGEHLGNL